MRTRLIPYAGWFALALGGIGGTSCSNLDIGQERDPPGPLNVTHVVFLDTRRGLSPDLLNADEEKRAAGLSSQGRACDFADPCPPPVICGALLFQGASTGIFAPFDDTPNVCHDPDNFQEVLPTVDSVIRIGFNKLADNTTVNEQVTMNNVCPPPADPQVTVDRLRDDVLTVRDSAGVAVPPADFVCVNNTAGLFPSFYDRTGSPRFTSDTVLLPYGPALVFVPRDPLRPGETYTITLNPARVVARNNQQPPTAEDLTFTFTVEGLSMFLPDNGDGIPRNCPHLSADSACDLSFPADGEAIGTTDDLAYTFTADIDISNATIEVRDSSGNPITPGAAPNIVNDSPYRQPPAGRPRQPPYNGRPRTLIIPAPASDWAVGTGYVVSISGVRAANGGAVAPAFTATFNVE